MAKPLVVQFLKTIDVHIQYLVFCGLIIDISMKNQSQDGKDVNGFVF